jgi:hypothetical protein
MRRSCSLALLLALAAPIWSTAASAQDDAAVEMARERFQEGVKYYDAKQYDKARAAFLQAYALKKHPAVLLNLAQSELRSAHEADAAKHFAQYLRENTAASAMERQEAEKGLSSAKVFVAEITVNVDGAPGSEIAVDGSAYGTAPLPGPIYLKPGNHTVEAKNGAQVTSQAVTATAAQTGAVTLSFGGEGAAPPPAGGVPGGPTGEPGPSPGAGGGAAFQADTGQPRQPFFEWAAENKVAWVGAGLTAVGLIGGIGFAIAAKASYDDADSIADKIRAEAIRRNVTGPCGPPPDPVFAQACSSRQDNVDEGDSRKTLSVVSFVVAGAAAAGTVIYYFVDTGGSKESVGRGRSPRPRAAFVPFVSPELSGLAISGSF